MLYNVMYQCAKFTFETGKVARFELTTLALELVDDLMNDWCDFIVLGMSGTGKGISNRYIYMPLKLGFINEQLPH